MLVEVGEELVLAGLDHEVDLDGAGLAEPVEPADALLQHERRLGEVGADEVRGELEVAPLAAGLAGEEQARALRVAEAGHQPVAGLQRAGGVVAERLEAGNGDAGLQLGQLAGVGAEDQHLLAGLGQAGAEIHQRLHAAALGDVEALQLAGGEGAHLDAPVADEPGGERVVVGEVGQQVVGGLLAVLEDEVVGGELAQLLQGRGHAAAAQQLAGDGGVVLVALEPGEEALLGGAGDGLDQGEEAVVLARVEPDRRGGEQEGAEGAAAERGHHAVEGVVGQVVGLVDDDEVERLGDGGHGQLRGGEQGLEGDDGERRAGERRLGAAQLLDARQGEEREEGVELVEELGQPLEGEVLGDHHQDALGEAELAHAGEDQAGLDGLAEADLVGEDEAREAVGEDAAGGADLVGEDVDAGGEERAEAVGAAQGLEAEGAGAERPGGGRAGLAGGERVERAAGVGVDGGVVGDGQQGRVAAGDHGDAVAAGEADGHAAAVVVDLDDDADAPGALGAVDDLLPLLEGHSGGVVPLCEAERGGQEGAQPREVPEGGGR